MAKGLEADGVVAEGNMFNLLRYLGVSPVGFSGIGVCKKNRHTKCPRLTPPLEEWGREVNKLFCGSFLRYDLNRGTQVKTAPLIKLKRHSAHVQSNLRFLHRKSTIL